MNHITLTHELSAEDRARIDRLTAALEALQPPTVHIDPPTPAQIGDTLEEPKIAAGEPKPSAEVNTPTVEEKPAEDSALPWEDTESAPTTKEEPTLTADQVQQKVIALAAAKNGAHKKEVRAIIVAYAGKVSDIPEDKLPEVWAKLIAFEKEVLNA